MYFVNIGDYLHSYKGSGTIAAYYGVNAPDGWVVCDGQNGTPDLRGKFVYGGNIFSQYLYRNLYDDDVSKYAVDYIEQIQGGNNYQTLTNKVEMIDKYHNQESFSSLVPIDNIILTNPNIKNSHAGLNTTLYTINEKPFKNPQTKKERVINIGLDSIINNDILTPTQLNDIQQSENFYDKIPDVITNEQLIREENSQLKNRLDYVQDELEVDDTQLSQLKENVDNQIDIQNIEDMLESAENDVEVILPPNYDGYKYPSQKNINADLNLPPYYAMIYIMKL
tara:strand:- start:3214 stop:4053 length:840 start_codon:yes stop_codon:yes gene_type:complete